MPDVDTMQAEKRYMPCGCNGGASPRLLPGVQVDAEFVGWRQIIEQLRNLDGHLRKQERQLDALKDSSEKGRVGARLSKGRETIQGLLACCFAQANRLPSGPLRYACTTSAMTIDRSRDCYLRARSVASV